MVTMKGSSFFSGIGPHSLAYPAYLCHYPTKKQEHSLMAVLVASRKMYNGCLEELVTHYQETGKHMHLYEQDKHHGRKEHPDLPAVVVDTTLKRLHRSFTNFFRGRKQGRKVGFP